ncbi:RNA-guided endonuclease InsQ/TnpB family protein [Sporosarcina siberiensis]|uniref:RNA-guided endonuclease InsQ/TnpB family protein n=1 Tax=Sporosarcina siberiensis TaxID=1365606 RepID=A0ABW4SDZ4_9BACL
MIVLKREIIIVAKVKLYTNKIEQQLLYDTLQSNRDALNAVSQVAFKKGLTNANILQKETYEMVRRNFNLKAQMACNVARSVAGKYKALKTNGKSIVKPIRFQKPELVYSYNRDYSVRKDGKLSLGTLKGRIVISFERKGMSHFFDGAWRFKTMTLLLKKGTYFACFSMSQEVDAIETEKIQQIIGIDLGINFLSVGYDGKKASFVNGREIKDRRAKYQRLRKALQKKQTSSARRRLKHIGRRENRWMRDVNHQVTKALVTRYGSGALYVIEDLTNVRKATERVRKKDRYLTVSWSFHQFRLFLTYKVERAGAHIVAVDPKYTSQKCPKCSHTEKANRIKKMHTFCCRSCEYTSNDDRIAAMNLYYKGMKYLDSQKAMS